MLTQKKLGYVKREEKYPLHRTRFFTTAGIGPSPKSVMNMVNKKLHFQNKGPVHPKISKVMSAIEGGLRNKLGKTFGAEATRLH